MRSGNSIGGILLLLTALVASGCSRVILPQACSGPSRPVIAKSLSLDPVVQETSGLVDIDGTIWTMNDSGGEAALYALDKNGSVMHKTVIQNTLNVDWEDLDEDEEYIYVADVGNNFAGRDTLSILMIRKDRLYDEDGLAVSGVIRFSYSEAARTNATGWSSNDCEALVSWGDSLYLFTKDWVGYTSSVYALPKKEGYYRVEPLLKLEIGALVTGAAVNASEKTVTLVGYVHYYPILFTYRFLSNPAQPECAKPVYLYPLFLGRQVEGICYTQDYKLLISSEGSLFKPSLFRVKE